MPVNLIRAQREFRERFNRGAAPFGGSVTSYWRTIDHNREVGGAAASQHLYGLAADVVGVPKRAFVVAMRAVGLVAIDEGDHIHVQRFLRGTLDQGVEPVTAGPTAPRRWRYRL